VDAAFNTFIDYVYSNPLADPFGAAGRHPLAKATEAGALTADASDFSVSMGVLDNGTPPAQKPGPTSTANLITIQLKKGTADQTTVTINGDTLRGPASGVVGSVLTSNLPQTVVVKFVTVCYTGPDQADWLAVGQPTSWCALRQCHGDADNAKETIGKGSFYVGYNDINILLAGFKGTYTNQAWIAADFDHKTEVIGKGTFRVGYNDINVLLKYFKAADAAVPADCQTATPVKP